MSDWRGDGTYTLEKSDPIEPENSILHENLEIREVSIVTQQEEDYFFQVTDGGRCEGTCHRALNPVREKIYYFQGCYMCLHCAHKIQAGEIGYRYRQLLQSYETMKKQYNQKHSEWLDMTVALGHAEIAVEKYSGHHDNCRVVQLVGRLTSADKCTCGYAKVKDNLTDELVKLGR